MLLLSLACASPTPSDDLGCTETTGTLHACVYDYEDDTVGLAGAKVQFATSGTEAYTTAITGDDGCVDVELDAGAYAVRGDDASQTCTTPATDVTITACAQTDARFDVAMWCVDG